MKKTVQPPSNAKEAILSRRNPCYGFVILVDTRENPDTNTYASFDANIMEQFQGVQKKILDLIVPERTQRVRDERYIKVKFFHGAVAASPPLVDKKDYLDEYLSFTGLLDKQELEKKSETLQKYLNKVSINLNFQSFELNEKDGTILARFGFQTNDLDDKTPILNLVKEIDPDSKLPRWDETNILRNTTIAVVICSIDSVVYSEKIQEIKKLLQDASEEFKAKQAASQETKLSVKGFWLLSFYDKRTLSLSHIEVYSHIAKDNITYNPLDIQEMKPKI